MQLELVDTLDGLRAAAVEWRALEVRSACHVFQSHEFVFSWLNTAGRFEGARPAVVLWRNAGKLAAVFPCCTVKRGPLKILTWLGGVYIVDYGDVILAPDAGIDATAFFDSSLRFLREKLGFALCYLYNIRHDSPVYPHVAEQFRPYRDDVAPFMYLKGTFGDYLDSLKRFRKKQKSDTLRQIRRLEETGVLEFSVVSSGDEDLDAVMEALIVQKRWRYSTTGIDGVLFRSGYAEFYRDQALNNPDAHLCCLRLDGRIIAAHLGYIYRDRMYFLMPSYDPEFSRYSPGRVLTYFLIRECYERGVKVFDFCGGNEEYKYEWTDLSAGETSFVDNGFFGEMFVLYKKAWRMKKQIMNKAVS